MPGMPKETMKKIGITGVMGAGKSSVMEILRTLGYTVLDCDRINADLLLQGNAGYKALRNCFGDVMLNQAGEIDHVRMSSFIFSDVAKKKAAEDILHPLIQEVITKEIKAHSGEVLVFVEVPLLYEVHWESFFDQVWVVASDETLLMKRLMLHRGVSEGEARVRLAHQISQEEKVKRADVVLWNNCDKEHLKQQICDILVHIN